MTDEIKKMTAHSSSVGADDGQSISQNSKTTIPDSDEKSNSPERDLEELYRKMRRMSDPAYLHTVTLDELMDNVFEGKSFLVAQIAHHISTGQDLWGYKVQEQSSILLWKMTKAVCSAGCSVCLVWRGQALSTLLPVPR